MAISFILNDQDITTDAASGLLVLDFVRKQQRLCGTKEGCKEGDCGACMVLVGERSGDGNITYKPETSCLLPLGEVAGKHIVTVEGLNMKSLSPVQQAIVDTGASQCGYCTPGFVVSLTGLLMDCTKSLEEDDVKYALGGNLCRCTGYRSLKEAGEILKDHWAASLKGDRVPALVKGGALPAYFLEVPERLHQLPSEKGDRRPTPKAFNIAGGTDLYVQQGEAIPDAGVEILNAYPEMKGISKDGPFITVGTLTTFEEFGTNPIITGMIPGMLDYLLLMASWQIRNRATLGGNLVNASPIADMTSLLMALRCTLTLQNGAGSREVKLDNFYQDYKVIDRQPDEFMTTISFPVFPDNTFFNWEKLSKRLSLDIATVNSGCRIQVKDNIIEDIDLSFGGVAAVPLSMQGTCTALKDKPLTDDTILEAIDAAQEEISPISDVRGTAEYRRLLTRQFLIAHFTTLFPEQFSLETFYETS